MTYFVIACFPGCMPENEPADFTNRREAERYASQLAREWQEGNEGSRKQGSRGDYSVTWGDHGAGVRVYVQEG